MLLSIPAGPGPQHHLPLTHIQGVFVIFAAEAQRSHVYHTYCWGSYRSLVELRPAAVPLV